MICRCVWKIEYERISKLNQDLYEEEIVWSLNERFTGKYDFEEYKDLQKPKNSVLNRVKKIAYNEYANELI